MAEILAVRGVVKTFGDVRAVDGVSFAVRRGTITGLLGRNGAGKTTTIRMITGIFLPDSGEIEWLGGKVAGRGYRDHIGYLPEERGLYKQMKLVELLLFLAEIKGCRPADVDRKRHTSELQSQSNLVCRLLLEKKKKKKNNIKKKRQ